MAPVAPNLVTSVLDNKLPRRHKTRSAYLEDLARLRELAYRLFSSALLYPDEKRSKALAAASRELHKQRYSMVQFAFFPEWQRVLTCLADPPGQTSLGEEYVRVFIHGPKGKPCLSYESVYVDPWGRAAGWVLASLEREYAAAGLALSPSLKDRPDHVAVELEFMAFLCGQEADAWERRVVEEGIQTLERQAAFLDRHLTRWVPQWARQVEAAAGQGVYSVVAEATQTFTSHDRDLIGVLLDRFQEMQEGTQAETAAKVAAGKQQRPRSRNHAP